VTHSRERLGPEMYYTFSIIARTTLIYKTDWRAHIDHICCVRNCTRRPGDARLIFRAAQALFAGAPNASLARVCGVPKATARSWRQGRRRAPLPVLRQLHSMLQARAAECDDLWRELGIEIPRREGEPRAVADLWKFASARAGERAARQTQSALAAETAPQVGQLVRRRDCPLSGDCVAKVESCRSTNFSRKHETRSNHRSAQPQSRYRSHLRV
jgi:hypothetical protein